MWTVSCVSYRWYSLISEYRSLHPLVRPWPKRFLVGKNSGNSLVAYRRHCSHCRYRRVNLRSSLPPMVDFLTSDRLNTTYIVCEAMYAVFHSNFASCVVCRRYKPCEFLGFVWTDCWGNKSHYVITSPANSEWWTHYSPAKWLRHTIVTRSRYFCYTP